MGEVTPTMVMVGPSQARRASAVEYQDIYLTIAMRVNQQHGEEDNLTGIRIVETIETGSASEMHLVMRDLDLAIGPKINHESGNTIVMMIE